MTNALGSTVSTFGAVVDRAVHSHFGVSSFHELVLIKCQSASDLKKRDAIQDVIFACYMGVDEALTAAFAAAEIPWHAVVGEETITQSQAEALAKYINKEELIPAAVRYQLKTLIGLLIPEVLSPKLRTPTYISEVVEDLYRHLRKALLDAAHVVCLQLPTLRRCNAQHLVLRGMAQAAIHNFNKIGYEAGW